MGVRYRNSFYSLDNVNYQVDIYDSAYSSTVNLFNTDTAGFKLSYNGITERCDPVMASTLTIPCIVEDTAFETFINDIMTSQEERFTVVVYKGVNVYWRGVLLADQVQKEDISFPYSFNLTFTDGIARLRDIEYKNGGSSYTGRETLLKHILNCLSHTGTGGLFLTSDTFLQTSINWYDVHHQFTATKCPMAYTDLNHAIFYEIAEDGTTTYKKCSDVLEMILRTFNARIFMANGYYNIVQVQDFPNAYTTYRKFKKDGTYISSAGSSFRVSQVSTTRKAGGVYKYFPPLYAVKKIYKTKITNAANNNFLPPAYSYNPAVSFLNTIYIGSSTNVTFKISGTISGIFSSTAILQPPALYAKYYIVVKKTKISDSSVEYLHGSNVGANAGICSWSSSVDNFTVQTSSSSGYFWQNNTDFSFTTPPITDDCDITFQIVLMSLYKTNGSPYTMTGDDWFGFDCIGVKAFSSFDFATSQSIDIEFSSYNMVTGGGYVASKAVLQVPETLIGDGPYNYSLGKLRTTSNLSTWYDSSLWGIRGATPSKKINQLSVENNLAGQRTPIENYQGGWINRAIGPDNVITWGVKAMVPATMAFNPAKDEVDGEFFNCVIPV